MKKTIKSLLAIAIAAFTFTACSDVPEPYQIPGTGGGGGGGQEITGAEGTGQLTDPYNCVAAINVGKALAVNATSDYVYIKGKVSSIKEQYSTQYGNGTFYISDDGTTKNQFYIFRAMYLGNAKFASGDTEIQKGDEVIICAKITNYNGTIETAQKEGFLYSLNGVDRGGDPTGGDVTGEPKGSGTLADPYNASAANAFIKKLAAGAESEQDIYVKGKFVKYANNGEFSTQYGNGSFYISDDGTENTEQFYVFRALYLGNQKYTGGETPKAGDDIVICGKVVYYQGNTPETAANKSYLYSLNGNTESSGGGGGEQGTGEGSETDPLDVTAAMAKESAPNSWVKGFIVGYVPGQKIAEAIFGTTGDGSVSNILIAASADETDYNKCMPIQLPAGTDVRTKLNLKDNPGNLKKEVTLYGNIEKYFGVTGIKSVTYAVLDGTGIGNKPSGEGGGGSTPSGDIQSVTIAQFNAAAVSDQVYYQITGTVKNLKEGDQYGNFDLEDETGTVYVYGLLSEKGGEKKKFQELVAAKGIANGSKITIIGTRGEYNGKIEVLNAYFVSISGGSDVTPPSGEVQTVSVADFNAAAVSNDVWYQLTGTVKNLKEGDQYGNFDLEDSTGSVYVYGVLSEKGGAKKKFQELVAAKGIANGKKITIIGNRGDYNGKIEVVNAYFVSVE